MSKPKCFGHRKGVSQSATPFDGWRTTSRSPSVLSRCRRSTTPFIGGKGSPHLGLPHSELRGVYVRICPGCSDNSFATGTFNSWNSRSHATHLRSNRCSSNTPQCWINYAITKKAVLDWSTDSAPQCCCTHWSKYREAALNPDDEHWVLAGHLLAPMITTSLGVIAEGSLLNKVFPSKKDFLHQLRQGIQGWCRRNGLPTIPHQAVNQLGAQLWQHHTDHITHHITKSSISQFQSHFDGAIYHCEDKHSSSLRVYCPCLYHKAITQTFTEPSVFQAVEESPETLIDSLVHHLQSTHGHQYPWAIGKGRTMPSGYILPKRKKAYQSGRPIISFVEAPFRPMLNILARLIFQLIPVVCPNHFASGDVYDLLKILREGPVHGDLVIFNPDLAGFFTSIDQNRFIGAWHMLLDFRQPHMNVSDNEVFSVYPGTTNNPGDLIKGRTFRKLNVTRKIIIKTIPSLLRTALNMQTFALGQKCVRQQRGSPMGSPLSPALCLMVVSISEQIWSITYKSTLSNHNLFICHLRYVGNRLIFGDTRLQNLEPYATLLDESFYGRPILLETEPDQEFLGFMLETKPLEIIYSGPTNVSQVMSPFSASPPKVLLSSFRSRCHILTKGAFPAHRIQQGLDQLVELLYSLACFDRQELLSLTFQIQLRTNQAPKKACLGSARETGEIPVWQIDSPSQYSITFPAAAVLTQAHTGLALYIVSPFPNSNGSGPWTRNSPSFGTWRVHLNSLAGFLPFFEPTVNWEDAHMVSPRTHEPTPNTLRYGRLSTSRMHPHLHTPYPTLASHGDLPRHMVSNPVPHFRPITSTMSSRVPDQEAGTDSTPSLLPIHHDPAIPDGASIPSDRRVEDRPSKRPRTVGPCEEGLIILPPQPKPPVGFPPSPVNNPVPKATSLPHSTVTTPMPPQNLPSSHTPADSAPTDSSDHDVGPGPASHDTAHNTARAVSIVLARSRQRREERERELQVRAYKAGSVPRTHPATLLASSVSATASHGPPVASSAPMDVVPEGMPIPFKPWTNAEDRELAAYKTDTKSRPSWKTIGARLNRNPEVCGLRWAAIKTTVQPPRPEPEAEDPE